jgi:S-adenosylmethionine-diacylglycerol 3-amino-3-carboxypropyl transferase
VVGSAIDIIRNSPYGSFDRFVLLDAQDWMNREVLTELWRTLAQRAEPGSRIIFRTAQSRSPLEQNLPKHLLERFSYEKEASEEFFAQDRASIYGGFHLYVVK